MAYKKFTASEDMLKPDPRFNSKLVSKFINCLMWDGKKTVAQKIFYGAMDQVDQEDEGRSAAGSLRDGDQQRQAVRRSAQPAASAGPTTRCRCR